MRTQTKTLKNKGILIENQQVGTENVFFQDRKGQFAPRSVELGINN